MSQRLILPLRGAVRVNAGYKVDAYLESKGYQHYGIDLGCDNRTVYGIGEGRVIAAGMDGKTDKELSGNAVVILYPGVLPRCTRTTANNVKVEADKPRDIVCRMFHFDKLLVKAGDKVTTETAIGVYGSTGAYTTGPHLHLEFDIDTQYPQYAYGVAGNGKVIKKGTVDSTLDPSLVWWLGEGQRIGPANQSWMDQGWVYQNDIDIPRLPEEVDWKAKVKELAAENTRLQARAMDLQNKLDEIRRIAG